MSQSKQFLRTPAAFSINLHSNCYRRCLEIKNIPLLFRCFVIIMTRGNTITIDIAMETVSLSRADSLLRSNVKKNTVALLRKDSHRHLLKMKNNNDSIKNPPSLQITVYFSQVVKEITLLCCEILPFVNLVCYRLAYPACPLFFGRSYCTPRCLLFVEPSCNKTIISYLSFRSKHYKWILNWYTLFVYVL
jgi:hypothetical protein